MAGDGATEAGSVNRWSGSGDVAANNIVAFDHCGYAHAGFAIFQAAFDAHNFAECANENVIAMGDFAGQGESNVQLGPGFQVLGYDKIKSPGRDVSRFAILLIDQFFG